MSLEQEAAAYTKGKQTQFNEALADYILPLKQYLQDNLYSTKELDDALCYLLLVKLLCTHSAETHGIK